MTQITVKINGLDKVQIGLQNIGRAIPALSARAIKTQMEKAKEEASGLYPAGGHSGYIVAPPLRSKYVRTGRYGSRMQVVRNGPQDYTLRAGAPYSVYVGGDSQGYGQAQVHSGRWPVIRKVVDKFVTPCAEQIDTDLGKIIRDEGMGL